MRAPYSYDAIRDKRIHKWVFKNEWSLEEHDALQILVEKNTTGTAYLKRTSVYKWKHRRQGTGETVNYSVVLLEDDADQMLFSMKYPMAHYRGCRNWSHGQSPLRAK